MSRKLTKKETEALIWLIIILIPVAILIIFLRTFGVVGILIILIAIGGGVWYHKKKQKERYEYLIEKYKDEKIVNAIQKKLIWQNQKVEQLIDTIGNPADIDSKILKTKKKEIFKYYPDGANRFKLRVTLENDIVTGWQKR